MSATNTAQGWERQPGCYNSLTCIAGRYGRRLVIRRLLLPPPGEALLSHQQLGRYVVQRNVQQHELPKYVCAGELVFAVRTQEAACTRRVLQDVVEARARNVPTRRQEHQHKLIHLVWEHAGTLLPPHLTNFPSTTIRLAKRRDVHETLIMTRITKWNGHSIAKCAPLPPLTPTRSLRASTCRIQTTTTIQLRHA
jgi:hypothetical protein